MKEIAKGTSGLLEQSLRIGLTGKLQSIRKEPLHPCQKIRGGVYGVTKEF
jgi:hypothetical protein